MRTELVIGMLAATTNLVGPLLAQYLVIRSHRLARRLESGDPELTQLESIQVIRFGLTWVWLAFAGSLLFDGFVFFTEIARSRSPNWIALLVVLMLSLQCYGLISIANRNRIEALERKIARAVDAMIAISRSHRKDSETLTSLLTQAVNQMDSDRLANRTRIRAIQRTLGKAVDKKTQTLVQTAQDLSEQIKDQLICQMRDQTVQYQRAVEGLIATLNKFGNDGARTYAELLVELKDLKSLNAINQTQGRPLEGYLVPSGKQSLSAPQDTTKALPQRKKSVSGTSKIE